MAEDRRIGGNYPPGEWQQGEPPRSAGARPSVDPDDAPVLHRSQGYAAESPGRHDYLSREATAADTAAYDMRGGVQGAARGPKNYRRSDERIQEDVCDALMYSELDASDVSVDVRDAVVVLQGTVPERRLKRAIEDVAARCRGVVDVQNEIRIAAPHAT
jgi:hypothetical protein